MIPLFAALLAASPAHADDALRGRCLDLLSAYETPPSAPEWRALGDGAPAELFAIAQDSTLSHTRRANAIVALGWFPSEGHYTWLSGLAAAPGDSLFRRKAVYALANGWGDAALAPVSAALRDPADIQLRAAAARALGNVGTSAARDVLRSALTAEADSMVRDTVRDALGEKAGPR